VSSRVEPSRYTFLALKLALLAAIVVLIAILPRLTGEFRTGQFTLVAIYFIALAGLNILTGYSGQISLGHYAFVGIGAYTTAVLMLGRPGMEGYGLNPPGWLPLGDGMRGVLTIPLAALVAGIFGYAFGLPAQRLAGVSLALATFAIAVSLPQVAKRFDQVTGGGGGLSLNLPSTPFGWDISVRNWLYYEAWVTAGILALTAWLLLRGRAGRALGALRDGEVAAVSSGVNPTAYKTFAFGISAAYAGVAGALLAIDVAYVNPDSFPLSQSILLLAALVLGGLGSLYGALIGALVMQFLPIYTQDPPLISSHLSDRAPAVVFGLILILVVLVAPTGIVGLLRRLLRPIIARLNPSRVVIGERRSLGRSRRSEL
jgi:branched-chain amino acid transport system permease protein